MGGLECALGMLVLTSLQALLNALVQGVGAIALAFWRWLCSFDWSQFFPDLIVGAATGVFAGLVIFRLQQREERRRAVADGQREWEALRPALLYAMESQWTWSDESLTVVPQTLKDVRLVAETRDLARLDGLLQVPALRQLRQALSDGQMLEVRARNLENLLTEKVMAADKTGVAATRFLRARLARSRIYRVPDTELVGVLASHALPLLGADVDEILTQLADQIAGFQEVTDATKEDLKILHSLVYAESRPGAQLGT